MAAGQLGRACSVPVECALAQQSASGELLADMMLPGIQFRRKSPLGFARPSDVKARLLDIARKLRSISFNRKFPIKRFICREEYLEHLATVRGYATIYLTHENEATMARKVLEGYASKPTMPVWSLGRGEQTKRSQNHSKTLQGNIQTYIINSYLLI